MIEGVVFSFPTKGRDFSPKCDDSLLPIVRDPDRIDRICQLLAEKWKKYPQQRLGQFLINNVFYVPPKADLGMYMQQDKTTEKRLETLEERLMRRAKNQKAITDFGGTSGK